MTLTEADSLVLGHDLKDGAAASRKPSRTGRGANLAGSVPCLVWGGEGFEVHIRVDWYICPNTQKPAPASIILNVGGNCYYTNTDWAVSGGCQRFTEWLDGLRKNRFPEYTRQKYLVEFKGNLERILKRPEFDVFRVAQPARPVERQRARSIALHRPQWVSPELWTALLADRNKNCWCCNTFLVADLGASVHHVNPRKYGGKDTHENLCLICHACHDRIEQAEEASLEAWGKPPRKDQLFDVFTRPGLIAAPTGPQQISAETKARHAARVLNLGPKRAGLLLEYQKRHGSWVHVDWVAVAEGLTGPQEGQAQ